MRDDARRVLRSKASRGAGPPATAMVSVGPVGVSFVSARVRRSRSGRPVRLRFLVDTGAVYTVLPRSVWSRLRLRPHRTVEFTLTDGGVIARPVSACWIEVEGTSAPSPVVLGEADDGPLLGAVTPETLGLMGNPPSRQVLPVRLPPDPPPASPVAAPWAH